MRQVRRVIIPLLFLAVAIGVVFFLVYGSGTLFVQLRRPDRLLIGPTLVPPPVGTPVSRFEQVNPDVVNAINQFETGYGDAAAPLFALEVQPLGAYLPRTGNRQLALQEPTPLPTPFPYPTTPPLPAPAIPNVPLPTLVPDSLIETDSDRTLPFDGLIDNCAPAGVPVDGVLTQRYHRYHLGIDIGVPIGTPVIATHSGTVIYADWNDIGYGYLVILQSGSFITYYAHNSSFNVVQGQLVGVGSVLAWSGSTGNSSGPHVHYETRINDVNVDPLTFENRGYRTC
jgi:murein DD-endopeptidase MepM/ murein hydrolase activator NlpD